MNKKEITKSKADFNRLHKAKKFFDAEQLSITILQEMFKKQMYENIVDFSLKFLKNSYDSYYSFEVAYSFIHVDENKYLLEAKEIYEMILVEDLDNAPVLNNLSNIYKAKGEYDKAFDLITKAYSLDNEDDIYKRNYTSLKTMMEEKNSIKRLFEEAKEHLKMENKWVFGKLENFIKNIKKETHENGRYTISNRKFSWLMKTTEEKASELRDQWLEKGYIRDTGERGEFNMHIYEINPYLENYLNDIKPKELPANWVNNIDKLNEGDLEALKFFEIVKKISRINKKYKSIVLRDFKELIFNCLFENEKSVVILSGSIIETIFMYYCEKKGIGNITYTLNKKTVNVALKNCVLSDYLEYIEQNKMFDAIVKAIADVARIYRNMIHPGNEIEKSKTGLSKSKKEICYSAVIEIISEVL